MSWRNSPVWSRVVLVYWEPGSKLQHAGCVAQQIGPQHATFAQARFKSQHFDGDFPAACSRVVNSLSGSIFSYNNIKHVGKPKNHFTSFVLHLNLSHNSIEEFPSCVSEGFPLLTHLDLSHNYMRQLPGYEVKNEEKVSKLENAEGKQVEKTELETTVKLSKLHILNLCHNKIEVVPCKFPNAPHQLGNIPSFTQRVNKPSR